MPQLEKFERSGSKTDTDDVTCLDSPGNNKFPAPVVVDNGNYQAEGVYDPQNAGITALQTYQQNMTLPLYYRITLVDGTTCTGQSFVSKFEAPKVDRYKRNRFSFEVTIFGVETLTPAGGSPISE
jgi:hypothetical protein